MELALPEEVSKALAAEIRDRRIKAGLSQEEVAKRALFRGTTIYQRLEYHERECRIPQLVAIGNVYGVPSYELLRGAYIRASRGDYPDQPSPP